MKEYPQYPGKFDAAVPAPAMPQGGSRSGWVVRCKGWETDPDAYIYMITQLQAFPALAKLIGHEDWLSDPNFNTPEARLPRLDHIFAEIEKWTKTMTKFEVMAVCNPLNIPCSPIMSMKEIAEEPALRNTGTVVKWIIRAGASIPVGNPIKLSEFPGRCAPFALAGRAYR